MVIFMKSDVTIMKQNFKSHYTIIFVSRPKRFGDHCMQMPWFIKLIVCRMRCKQAAIWLAQVYLRGLSTIRTNTPYHFEYTATYYSVIQLLNVVITESAPCCSDCNTVTLTCFVIVYVFQHSKYKLTYYNFHGLAVCKQTAM